MLASRPTARDGGSPTLLLDRDGVVSVNRDDYVRSWEDFEFLPGVLEALALLHANGFRIVIVTNQSAINRGLATEEDIVACHRQMLAAVEDAGGYIEGVLVCPHRTDEGCDCRKPAPGLLIRAARRFGFALADALLVGDHATDLEAASRVGCASILVLSGRSSASDLHLLPETCLGTLPDLLSVARHLTLRSEVR